MRGDVGRDSDLTSALGTAPCLAAQVGAPSEFDDDARSNAPWVERDATRIHCDMQIGQVDLQERADSQRGRVRVGRCEGFLRTGSTLAIVIITDEADCSVAAPHGFSFFGDVNDTEYWADNPDLEGPIPSSAICWNAGVVCTGDDGEGGYTECHSNPDDPVLHPTSRYTDFFAHLRDAMSIDVVMLGVLGVPLVTAHAETRPHVPTQGGAAALSYRDWRDGEFDGTQTGGDILPAEWADGVTAADKQWQFGIGPGCTEWDPEEGFAGQAMPPVRVLEVCRSLDGAGAHARCCIESICDSDFSAAIDCLTGVVEAAAVQEG